MIPELKRCLPGTEFPLSIEFTTEGFKNILDDIFERHKIKCPRPRTTARMLKKVPLYFNINFILESDLLDDHKYYSLICNS